MAKPPNGTRMIRPSASVSDKETASRDYQIFQSYSEKEWDKTAYYKDSGGFVVTSLQRIEYAKSKGKTEQDKFNKEQNMCKRYASWGFQIQQESEYSGISSADVTVVKHGYKSRVIVNGKRADLKQLSSSNNIVRHAKEAVKKQGADFVMFEFTKHARGIPQRIDELKRKGIHGYYFYSDENTYHSF